MIKKMVEVFTKNRANGDSNIDLYIERSQELIAEQVLKLIVGPLIQSIIDTLQNVPGVDTRTGTETALPAYTPCKKKESGECNGEKYQTARAT